MRRAAFILAAAAAAATMSAAQAQPAPAARLAGGPPNFRAIYAATQPKEMVNSVGMTFEPIPEGSFVMGRFAPSCPAAPKPGATPNPNWTPAVYARCRAVALKARRSGFVADIPRTFMMGKTEVTQAQYEKVMGANPSYFQGARAGGDTANRPVDSVSWQDAQAFVAKLNALEHTHAYRLPTEAEWEWAARAGSEPTTAWVVFNFDNVTVGWFQAQADATSDVAGKKPNAWGLYDTLGNVWEWVADVYNDRFLPDAKPPKTGKTHVLKGGSFLRDGNMAFPTDHAGGPGNTIDVGFRVARDVE